MINVKWIQFYWVKMVTRIETILSNITRNFRHLMSIELASEMMCDSDIYSALLRNSSSTTLQWLSWVFRWCQHTSMSSLVCLLVCFAVSPTYIICRAACWIIPNPVFAQGLMSEIEFTGSNYLRFRPHPLRVTMSLFPTILNAEINAAAESQNYRFCYII